jgi:hypothetical protein
VSSANVSYKPTKLLFFHANECFLPVGNYCCLYYVTSKEILIYFDTEGLEK